MKITKMTKKYLQQQTAFLLVFVMLFSLLPSRQVLATNVDENSVDHFLNPPILDNLEDSVFSTFSTNSTTLSIEQPSQARQNYNKLLEGNYFPVELRQRFVELFGEHSEEYILQNYANIFDIPSGQVDEALLNVLTNGLLHDSKMARFAHLRTNNLNNSNLLLSDVSPPTLATEIFVLPTENPTITTPSAIYPNIETNETVDNYSFGINRSTNDVNIKVVSVTNTSITLDLYFNTKYYNANNLLRYYDFTQANPPYNGSWVYVLGQGQPIGTSGTHTINNLTPGATYNFVASVWDSDNQVWISHETQVQTTGLGAFSLNLGNSTPTSFNFDVNFPVNGDNGNLIKLHDGTDWVNLKEKATSGTFTVDNLLPGNTYIIYAFYTNRKTNESNSLDFSLNLPLPPEQLQTFTRQNVHFELDTVKVAAFAGYLNKFLDSTNSAYGLIHNLVGGNLPFNGNPMVIRSSRTLPNTIEGLSGQPIQWSMYNYPYISGLQQVRNSTAHGIAVHETPIHEIAHNFQSTRWNFEAEALAIFKTYYFFATTGESVTVYNSNGKIFSGSQFRDYMKSYANRINGHVNYDATIPYGIYSPYGLAYNLATISDKIGWESFRQTFRYFEELQGSQVPTSKLDKFNLFLTQLSDFSNRDVFAMFTAQERSVYEKYFGGTIQRFEVGEYVEPNDVTVEYKSSNHTSGEVPPKQTLTTPGGFIVQDQGTLLRDGYTFLGWSTGSDYIYKPGATIQWNYVVHGMLYLEAVWEQNTDAFANVSWWRYDDSNTDTSFYVTTAPVANFVGFSNVFVGITRNYNQNTGDVYVLVDNAWDYVGLANFTSTRNLARNVVMQNPPNVSYTQNGNPLQIASLSNLYNHIWLARNRPSEGTLVYTVLMPTGDIMQLTHDEVVDRFGVDVANQFRATSNTRFAVAIPVAIGVAVVWVLAAAVVVNPSLIGLDPNFTAISLPNFTPWLPDLTSPSVVNPSTFNFRQGSIRNLWQSDVNNLESAWQLAVQTGHITDSATEHVSDQVLAEVIINHLSDFRAYDSTLPNNHKVLFVFQLKSDIIGDFSSNLDHNTGLDNTNDTIPAGTFVYLLYNSDKNIVFHFHIRFFGDFDTERLRHYNQLDRQHIPNIVVDSRYLSPDPNHPWPLSNNGDVRQR
ncbi:MAG: M60 family metallopeptidase [Firmicutes bacterium]|nr:M60 family metallopeptidase [Bacillota bacterium]